MHGAMTNIRGLVQTRPYCSWILRQAKERRKNAKKKTAMMSPPFKPQRFDSLLVLDFEATCERDARLEPQEIIEFPCLRLSTNTFEVESTFHRYVRPVAHPNLTLFCTELTGIYQDVVADKETFPVVLRDFTDWLESQDGLGEYTFVTCGDWDLKTMVVKQCEYSGLSVPACFDRWINVKKSYHSTTGTFPRHLSAMLEGLGMRFEGRPHSGIDDCKNIARIVKALALKGHVFQDTYRR